MASLGQPWAPLDGKRWVTTFRLPHGHLTLSLETLLPLLQTSVAGCSQVVALLRSGASVITVPTDPQWAPVVNVPRHCAQDRTGGHVALTCSERLPTHTAQVSEWETPMKGPLLVPTASLHKNTTNINSPTSYVYLHIYAHTYIKRMCCANPKIKSRRVHLIEKKTSQCIAKVNVK